MFLDFTTKDTVVLYTYRYDVEPLVTLLRTTHTHTHTHIYIYIYIFPEDSRDRSKHIGNTGLFEMIVGVLTTCHTQNT